MQKVALVRGRIELRCTHAVGGSGASPSSTHFLAREEEMQPAQSKQKLSGRRLSGCQAQTEAK